MATMKLLGKIPNEVIVACSGGPDSMAALHFVRQVPARKVSVAFFDHLTPNSEHALKFLRPYCESNGLELLVGRIQRQISSRESPEEFWRNERYDFFRKFPDKTFITGHNLDDCCETWIFTALHGSPKLIPYRNQNVIRPFLLTPKKSMLDWCERHKVPYVLDDSNYDMNYMRNRIRHKIMPEALVVNPGLRKTISKKLSQ